MTSAGTRRRGGADAVEALGGGVERRGALARARRRRSAARHPARPRRRTRRAAAAARSSRRRQVPAAQVDARDGAGRGRAAAGGAEGHAPSLGFARGRPRTPSTPRGGRPSFRSRPGGPEQMGAWHDRPPPRRPSTGSPSLVARTPVRAGVGVAPAPRPQERQGVRGPDRGDPDRHDASSSPWRGGAGPTGCATCGRPEGARSAGGACDYACTRADVRRPGGRRGVGARPRCGWVCDTSTSRGGFIQLDRRPRADRGRCRGCPTRVRRRRTRPRGRPGRGARCGGSARPGPGPTRRAARGCARCRRRRAGRSGTASRARARKSTPALRIDDASRHDAERSTACSGATRPSRSAASSAPIVDVVRSPGCS